MSLKKIAASMHVEAKAIGLRHGINIIEKLTQKDIVNINEMQARQDKRNHRRVFHRR